MSHTAPTPLSSKQTAPGKPLTDLLAALHEIATREDQLTAEINRLANEYGYESVSVHDRINYRVAAFPSLLALAKQVAQQALEAESTLAKVGSIRCQACDNPLSDGPGCCVSDAGRPHWYETDDLHAAFER
ncbi:hypothetical protein EN35_14345 [Rhodococcus qingshengii]|nr:hypothetical protein EN35_14345 [Rhodococcus qingshengii]